MSDPVEGRLPTGLRLYETSGLIDQSNVATNETTLDPITRYYADAQWSSRQNFVSKEYVTDMAFSNDDSSPAVWPSFTTSGHREHQSDMHAKGFDRSQSLEVEHGGHLSDHLVKAQITCDYCGEVSRCKSDHKKHMLKHDKPFKCNISSCQRSVKGFTTENDLARHKKSVHRIGGLQNVYQCASETCRNREKIWPRLDNFKQHIFRMHSGEDEQDLIRRSVFKLPPLPPEISSPPPLASEPHKDPVFAASSMSFVRGHHRESNDKDFGSPHEIPQVPQYVDVAHVLDGELKPNMQLDSGYGSMPDKNPRVIQQDDDVVSVRSIVTNGLRVRLPRHEEEHLISAFTGDLCQDMDLCGDIDALDRVIARLPDLLRTFAMKLAKNVTCKAKSDAAEFVRQQRNRITRQFQENKLPENHCEDEDLSNTPVDGMSLAEKMALWDMAEEGITHRGLNEDGQQLEEIVFPPRYQEVRSFLLHGPEYDWLLKNCRSSALLTHTDGTTMELFSQPIVDMLSSMRPSKSQQAQIYQVTFDIDWDLPGFLRHQRYDTTLEIAIERAITLTGSIVNAQALSCLDYMCQTWPSTGNEVVRTLQSALSQEDFSSSSCLSDGTEIAVSLSALRTTIVARGDQTALTELCEQLAWLSAALRPSSISAGVCLSTPTLLDVCKNQPTFSSIPTITICLGFNMDPCVPTSLGGTCWHALFRNPVVVTGFPILARPNNEQGLELSLDVMTTLAESQFSTHYDATLILKGLFTMLVPTRRTERTITWHFLSSTGAKRLPYNAFREGLSEWIGVDEMNIHDLETEGLRNFVGWTSDITRNLGTQDVEYEKLDWAGAMKCSAGLAVEQKLTVSASKVLGISGSIIRGDRDKPVYVKSSAYSVQIDNARDWYVVLYDAESQRGWLTDGASALLHLVRAQVAREPYGGASPYFNNKQFNLLEFIHPTTSGGPEEAVKILKDSRNMKHVILKEFVSYDDQKITLENHVTAMPFTNEKIRSEIYKTTCFRDLVSQTWSTLEQIYDRQTEILSTHTAKQLPNPFKRNLEGYEFMGIVVGRRLLTRRSIGLHSNGAAWEHFAKRINAITLLGRHFGEIYAPTTNSGKFVCNDWKTVPRGHEFLAAPTSLLRNIQQRSREEGEVEMNSSEIAEGFLWSPSKDAFRSCVTSCSHLLLSRVQQFRKSSWKNNPFYSSDIFATTTGAVLFGTSSALETGKLCVLPRSTETGTSFRDSGIGSMLPSLSPSHSALSFSGENSLVPPITPSLDTKLSASTLVGVNVEQNAQKTPVPPLSSFSSFPQGETNHEQTTPLGTTTTNASTLEAATLDDVTKKRKRSSLGPCKRLAMAIPSRWKGEDRS